ncbi:MAG: hypothetical protein ACOYM3_29465 [Terrimicrobiaceae bacterium]
MKHQDIEAAIKKYAAGYKALEDLQDGEMKKIKPEEKLLPKGDQKTGVAGEYWAMRYAREIWPQPAKIRFGGTSEKGWDLSVTNKNVTFQIQVKAASLFSADRILSPIRPPAEHWKELWIVLLDKKLSPIGFWTIGAHEFSRARSQSLRVREDTLGNKLYQVSLPETHSGVIRPAWLEAAVKNKIDDFRSKLGLSKLSRPPCPAK